MVDDSRGPYPEMERVEMLLAGACGVEFWGRFTDRLRRVLVFAAAEASLEVGDDPPEAVVVRVGDVLVGLALEGERDAGGGSLAARALRAVGVSSYDLRQAAQEPVNEPEGMTLKVPVGTWRHPLGSFRGWPKTLGLSLEVQRSLEFAARLRRREMRGPVDYPVDYVAADYVLEALMVDTLGREMVNACRNNTRTMSPTVVVVEESLAAVRLAASTVAARREPSMAVVDEASAGMRAPEAVTASTGRRLVAETGGHRLVSAGVGGLQCERCRLVGKNIDAFTEWCQPGGMRNPVMEFTGGAFGVPAWRGLAIDLMVDGWVEVHTVMIGDVPSLNFRVVAGEAAVGVDVPVSRCRGLADVILGELDPVDAVICEAETAEPNPDSQTAIGEMYASEQARLEAGRRLREKIMAAFDAGAMWAVAERRKETLSAEHKDEADRMSERHKAALAGARDDTSAHYGQRKRLAEEAALVVSEPQPPDSGPVVKVEGSDG